MSGYTFSIDHREYVTHRDGSPLTLADCWYAVKGCGGCRILHGGRIVLDNAGSLYVRSQVSGRRGRSSHPHLTFDAMSPHVWSEVA